MKRKPTGSATTIVFRRQPPFIPALYEQGAAMSVFMKNMAISAPKKTISPGVQ